MVESSQRRWIGWPFRQPAVLAALVIVATCGTLSGCLSGPDNRMLVARPHGARESGVERRACCDESQVGYGAACNSCGDEIWPEDVWEVGASGPVASGESIEMVVATNSEPGDAETNPPKEGRFARLRRPWRGRLYDKEAGLFNFFVPPATIGAPATPSPGRFHPVPARPVFSPQLPMASPMPVGLPLAPTG